MMASVSFHFSGLFLFLFFIRRNEEGITRSASYLLQVTNSLVLQAIVEGTPVARRLYEQCGLRAEIEEMRFDAEDEFVGRKKPKLIFLARGPQP
jgi:hypothetical protein